jgi:hypothetical protein
MSGAPAFSRPWWMKCLLGSELVGNERRSTCLRQGAPWPKATLVRCAACAQGTYLNATFIHLRAQPGPKNAACAPAASILTAYRMRKDGTFYQDPGSARFAPRRPEAQARRLAERPADLGFCVERKPPAAAS